MISLLLAAVLATDSLMSPGVSHALAMQRARQINDVTYDLSLDVTRADTALGHVRITFGVRTADDAILDFRGVALSQIAVNGRAVQLSAANGHLRVPAALLRRGARNVVDADFHSAIAPAGASIIRYHDATDDADYLYTLLVPSDAQALFPCFDQPDLKARVTLTLQTPPGWRALGNGRLVATDSTSAVHTTHRFAQSEPISTYFVAFAAGPWQTRTRTVGGRTITMWVRASRAREADADLDHPVDGAGGGSLIEMNARAIRWMEQYTGRAYPFQKYEFLLAPAFPFGGMEHPGAVFYNEESFIFREPPTRNQLLGREATVYHEVSHQWFGDFTTMRWFDDLWLKEGFATYIAAVMQSQLSPASNSWRTFFLRNKPVAYATDATRGTTPVWQTLGNLDQAKSNYGAIVYNKAPGILKQLNFLVGDAAFRAGLQSYLASHAYGNATWRDLLGAIGSAAHQDLDAWGDAYVLRAGMPIITQRVTPEREGWRLELTQQPAQALSGQTTWPIRTRVLIADSAGAERIVPVTFSGTTTTRHFQGTLPRLVFANAGDNAYALVRMDSASTRTVLTSLDAFVDPLQQAMLWSTLWDEVRDARLAPAAFVDAALKALPGERDDQLAPWIVGRTARAVDAYGCRDESRLRVQAESVFAAGAGDSTRSYSIRKAQLDALIAIGRSDMVLAHLSAALDSSSVFGLPLRAPTRWAIVTHLVERQHGDATRRLAAEAMRDSTSEGRRRLFVARAAMPDSASKAEYFHRYFADRSLNEDWVTASLGAFVDSDREALVRAYLIPALDSLPWIQQNRRIFFLGSWLGSFVSGMRTPESLALVNSFLDTHPALPADLRQKILQSADELERTVKIRSRYCASTSTPSGS